MTDIAGLNSHPHNSDAEITTPQEAMEYLKQLSAPSSRPMLRAADLTREEPRAWVDPPFIPHPDYQWKEYQLNWSGTPYSKWDWVAMFINVHRTSDYFFADNPPIMTAPDGTRYVMMEQQVGWQWVSNGNSYVLRIPNDWLEEERGSKFPWKEGEREPYARYFWWDYDAKAWATRGTPVSQS